MCQLSPERPTLRITEGEAPGRGGARGGGGGGTGAFEPVINVQENIKTYLPGMLEQKTISIFCINLFMN